MKLASLHTGQDLILNNVPYRLIRMLEDGQCQLERKSDLALSCYTKQELLGFITSGELVLSGQQSITTTPENNQRIEPDLSSYPESIQQQVYYRLKYLKKADELLGETITCSGLSRVIKLVSEESGDCAPPSTISLYRWRKRWIKADRSVTALVGYAKGPKNKRRIIKELEQLVQQLVNEIYLKAEGNSIEDVYAALKQKIKALNVNRNTHIPVPGRATFYRYVGTYDEYLIMSARKGKQAADRHFRATGKGPEPEYILERAEVDHTPLDLLIIDDLTGLTIGRPTVTFIIDRFSRLPLGFEIGFEPPSELAVMRALRHAITPKTYVSEEYPEVENAWLAFGIKVTLVCDNGLEFHAHQLRRMCAELNIELIFCPKKQPHYKGAIERFLGTFNRQLSHKIEGTTFSNIEQRGDYDAENLANLTLAEFKKLLHVWLIDVYIQAPHKSLGITPALAWKDGLKIIEPVLPESKEKLDLILAIQKTRKLNHEGVQFIGLMYNSAELAVLRKRGIASVTIRINPEDLGEIWVFDEHQGDYLKVPCTYLEYASKLTLAQHLLIRKKPTKPMQNASIWIYICGERKSCACLLLRSATARNSASEKRPLATTPKSFNNRPIRRMCYRQKSVSSLIKIIGLMTYRTLMLIVRRLNMLDQSKLNQTWASMSKLIIKYPAFNDAYQLLKDAYLFNLQTGLTKNYLLVGNGYR